MFSTYDIFDDVLQLRSMVDDFFNSVPSKRRKIYDYPYINIYEKNESIILKSIMPGISKADLNMELSGDSLIIEGERRRELLDKPYIRKERSFGRFHKSLKLPCLVKNEKINANLRDGILTITLEKCEEAKPKKIQIK